MSVDENLRHASIYNQRVHGRISSRRGFRTSVEIKTFEDLKHEANRKKIGKLLYSVSRVWAGKYPQLGFGLNHELALGVTHEDIVYTVIQKAISGERRWDPEKGELEYWLKEQVKSEVSNLATKAATLQELALPEPQPEEGRLDRLELRSGSVTDSLFAQPKTPEAVVLTKERYQQEADLIIAASGGDPQLEQLLDAIIEIHSAKPAELAPRLDRPVDEIYRLLRKLRRRINQLKKESLVHAQAN